MSAFGRIPSFTLAELSPHALGEPSQQPRQVAHYHPMPTPVGVATNLPHQRVPAPLYPDDKFEGNSTANLLGMQIYQWIGNGQIKQATAVLDHALSSKERLRDGRWVLGEAYRGYGEWLKGQGVWDAPLESVRKWRQSDPTNADAALIEARYWITYAWFARGHEFAANVPGDAFKTMRERAQRALAVLEDAKPYASDNPVWYHEMLEVGILQGWDAKRSFALFTEGIGREPYFYLTYASMATVLSPRWGG